MPLVFNFEIAPPGRLLLVRNLVLELKSDYSLSLNHVISNPDQARDCIWREWSSSLFDSVSIHFRVFLDSFPGFSQDIGMI